MKGYIVANVTVEDAEAYEAYRSKVEAIIERHGGRYLVRGGAVEVREGEPGISAAGDPRISERRGGADLLRQRGLSGDPADPDGQCRRRP